MKRGPTERRGRGGEKRGRSLSFLYQSVDVMLGAVLTVGHFEHARHTQQRLLGVPVRHHLPEQRERAFSGRGPTRSSRKRKQSYERQSIAGRNCI